MPLCKIHLLSLIPSTTIPSFLQAFSITPLKPLTIAQVIRWIILPSHISTTALLSQNIHWDLLLILSNTSPLPPTLQKLVAHEWTITAGVPSRLTNNFSQKNERLLHPHEGDIPPLKSSLHPPSSKTTPSSQNLSLSSELSTWIESFSQTPQGSGAISMFNLLSFHPGKKSSYLKYGSEFSKSIGSSRGGFAKIVGSVVHEKKFDGLGTEMEGDEEEGGGWDEVALAHYPSLRHFGEMLGSEDYQAVNQMYRVPSLSDTCILCTSEIGLGFEDGEVVKGKL